jgi:hypothetical protein
MRQRDFTSRDCMQIYNRRAHAELRHASSALFHFPQRRGATFNNETPAARQGGQQFALPSYAGFPENGRTIRWQISLATAPSVVSVQLQTAMNDVDARYAVPAGATYQSSASTTGDNLVATAVRANCVRAKVVPITGGSSVIVQILG